MISNTRGVKTQRKCVVGGTIFVNHAASKIDMYHQVSLGGSDTVRNKELYEQKVGEYGVEIKSYRGDNGVFKSQVFQDDINKRNQLLAFSGFGTHG